MSREVVLIFILLAIFFIVVNVLIYYFLRAINIEAPKLEAIVGTIYIDSILLFLISMFTHTSSHDFPIDPFVDKCYTPLSYNHLLTYTVFYILFIFSAYKTWRNMKLIPPLIRCGYSIFLIIGIAINILTWIQVSSHNTSRIPESGNHGDILRIQFMPILGILISVYLIFKLIINHADFNENKVYKNKKLNYLNTKLKSIKNYPLGVVLLGLPFFFLITLILIIFGQDIDSFYSVYSDTATWNLSQKTHPPPVLDKHGHYLCTVAAVGSPKIVKPKRLGIRRGKIILVNRQLQIANAFEEMVASISKKGHKEIRRIYDEYGYNLSTKINTKRGSNLVYILMKPLEWLFLFCLYLYYIEPEEIIKKQYRLKNGT